jgi:tRNA pseudouridine-54 N-methylase
MIAEKKKQERLLSKTYIFNNFQAACEKYEDIERLEKIPDEIFVVAFHRRFTKPAITVFQEFMPQIIASSVIMTLTANPTGR